MVFEDVISLTIPEGTVKSIHNSSNVLLWHRPKIYGVKWTGGTSATMTRTDDAAKFSTPVIGTGTTNGSSPFDSCYPWSKIRTVTDNGSVLVEIPKFWYKWTKSSATMTLQIADREMPGFYVSPMHANRGDGVGERDVAYIGKYKCTSNYKSRAGYAPKASISVNTARTGITALGTGYFQQDYASFWTIRMLFLVEWATWNSQSVLQNTANFASAADIVTGGTANMAYHTGVSANGYSVQYRYIEDPWENMLEWLDGLYFSGANMYCIKNPNNFKIGSGGKLVGTRTTSSGYIKSWTIPTASGFEWALIPSAVATSESYTYDSYYYNATGTVAYIGGTRSSWGVHGAFYMYTDFTATSTSTAITTRLMKLPS